MSKQKIKLGLFGFGCVGQGLYKVLEKNIGFKAEIVKICVRDKSLPRIISDHENVKGGYTYNQPSEGLFTCNKSDILDDPDINVVVEVTNDAEAALEIVVQALSKGKAVVTANKKMIAEHLKDILKLQQIYEVPVLYEAACCASIPVIRNFEEYYDNDFLSSFSGIMNGTTNYILSQIFARNISYEEALKSAQQKGYAESNPVMDINGYDSKYKLCILLAHAFGIAVDPSEIFNLGIQNINDFDIRFAKEKNSKIKLVARAQKLKSGGIAAFVLPELVSKDHQLYNVDGVFNGIVTESYFADKNIFIGKGAGEFPTASALLSDISALSYNYKYEYKKIHQNSSSFIDKDFLIDVYVRFRNSEVVNTYLFENIFERYFSKDNNYLTGRISFRNLIASGLLNKEGTNVILLNDIIKQSEEKLNILNSTVQTEVFV